MVFGLIQHIYHYFAPDMQKGVNNTSVGPAASPDSIPSTQDYVPMFNEHGKIQGYIKLPAPWCSGSYWACKERRKIKLDADSGGDNFIAAFAKLTEDYPGFVILSMLGKITVICVQTPFM
ncbi:hypothetical protein K443DRAFT_12320 [Laccaria amethystina LaAM-08-1]|uniref:Uncharacterized protein n=1 Tax=Laccaria amethystina LaAM-08-1 TaxID=1095629 RepID=A0A0C9XDA2_9AGAR|nr:hypothetical protein K443DRAFT_12320 [Laccaria amethystina LaAM-08-1]